MCARTVDMEARERSLEGKTLALPDPKVATLSGAVWGFALPPAGAL